MPENVRGRRLLSVSAHSSKAMSPSPRPVPAGGSRPETATAVGPVVRMCEEPHRAGWQSCPAANPLMGLADNLPSDLSDEVVLCLFRQNLSLSGPKDTAGVARIVPDSADFVLHKEDDLEGAGRWTAIYSGPEKTIDEALAGAPEYEANYDLVTDRLRRMRDAGLLDAALRWREQHPARAEVLDG